MNDWIFFFLNKATHVFLMINNLVPQTQKKLPKYK